MASHNRDHVDQSEAPHGFEVYAAHETGSNDGGPNALCSHAVSGEDISPPLDDARGRGGDVKDAKAYPIDLESEKVQFLEQMVSSYGLTDVGKAVRCLINYARENKDKHEEMFSEIRCTDC
jgi:hypothetical protein